MSYVSGNMVCREYLLGKYTTSVVDTGKKNGSLLRGSSARLNTQEKKEKPPKKLVPALLRAKQIYKRIMRNRLIVMRIHLSAYPLKNIPRFHLRHSSY